MRIKRAKSYKKSMTVYQHSFEFREPYQVLVDGNFFHVANHIRVDIQEKISTILFGNCKLSKFFLTLVTTNCVTSELKSMGHEFKGSFYGAKKLEKRRCTHQFLLTKGLENENNYCVATQDQALRAHFRAIPGIPLIYINKSVFILEPPSECTMKKVEQMELEKSRPKSFEKSILKTEEPQVLPVKKRKQKEPNPLSVKKKKLKIDSPVSTEEKPKRKRKRKQTAAEPEESAL